MRGTRRLPVFGEGLRDSRPTVIVSAVNTPPPFVRFILGLLCLVGAAPIVRPARAVGAAEPPSTRPAAVATAVATAAPATVPTAVAAADPRAGRIRFLEDRVRRDPDDITAQNWLSAEYLGRFRRTGDDADLTRALAAAQRSLATVPAEVNAGGLAARARAAFNLHGFAAARDDALKLAAREPDKKYPLEILGDALLELGDYDQAAEAYAKLE